MYIETTQKLSKDRQDTQSMENELNQINARINNIEKKGGTKMEIDIEKDRLKRQRVRVEKNIEESKKNEKVLLKTLKENQKATKDVARLQKMFDKQKQKEMTLERNLNRTKTLIELDEQKETFKRKIEEDKRIMEDENASPDQMKNKPQQIVLQKIQKRWKGWIHRFKKGKKLFLCVRGLKISLINMGGHCKRLFWLPA